MAGRRALLVGGTSLVLAVSLGGCEKPYYERNPAQKAFLDGLKVLAKPALASNNPLQVEEAAKQSLALSEKIGAFSDWQGVLKTIDGTAQNVSVTIEIGPQVSLHAFNDWTLAMAGSLADLLAFRSRRPPPPGLSEVAIAALKTFRLGDRVVVSGKMGEIAGSGLFDLSVLLGKSDAEHRLFLQAPRFVARIETIAVPSAKK